MAGSRKLNKYRRGPRGKGKYSTRVIQDVKYSRKRDTKNNGYKYPLEDDLT